MILFLDRLLGIQRPTDGLRPVYDADGWCLRGAPEPEGGPVSEELAERIDLLQTSELPAQVLRLAATMGETMLECPAWWEESAHEQHVWISDQKGRVLCPGWRPLDDNDFHDRLRSLPVSWITEMPAASCERRALQEQHDRHAFHSTDGWRCCPGLRTEVAG